MKVSYVGSSLTKCFFLGQRCILYALKLGYLCTIRGGPGVGFDLSTIVVGSLHHENTFKYQKSSRYSFITMIMGFFCHWEK